MPPRTARADSEKAPVRRSTRERMTGVALAHGLAIAVMVSAVGHISGGHFNPAITFGFWVTRRIEAKGAAVYWLAQFAGATAAALLVKWLIPGDALLHGVPTVSVI